MNDRLEIAARLLPFICDVATNDGRGSAMTLALGWADRLIEVEASTRPAPATLDPPGAPT